MTWPSSALGVYIVYDIPHTVFSAPPGRSRANAVYAVSGCAVLAVTFDDMQIHALPTCRCAGGRMLEMISAWHDSPCLLGGWYGGVLT